MSEKKAGRKFGEYGDFQYSVKTVRPAVGVANAISGNIAVAQRPAYVAPVLRADASFMPLAVTAITRMGTKQPNTEMTVMVDSLMRAQFGTDAEHKKRYADEKSAADDGIVLSAGYLVWALFNAVSSEPHRVLQLDRFMGRALWPYWKHVTDVNICTTHGVTQRYIPPTGIAPCNDFESGFMMPLPSARQMTNAALGWAALAAPNLTLGLLPNYKQYRPDAHSGHEAGDRPAGQTAAARDITRRFLGVGIMAWQQPRVPEARARLRWVNFMHALLLDYERVISPSDRAHALRTGMTTRAFDYVTRSEELVYALEATASLPCHPSLIHGEAPTMLAEVTAGSIDAREILTTMSIKDWYGSLPEPTRLSKFTSKAMTAAEFGYDLVRKYKEYLLATDAKLAGMSSIPEFATINTPPSVAQPSASQNGEPADKKEEEEEGVDPPANDSQASYDMLVKAGLVKTLSNGHRYIDPRVMWEVISTANGELLTGSKRGGGGGNDSENKSVLRDIAERIGWSGGLGNFKEGSVYSLHSVPLAIENGEQCSVPYEYVHAGLIRVMRWGGPEHGQQDPEWVAKPIDTLASASRAIVAYDVEPRGMLAPAASLSHVALASSDGGLSGDVDLGIIGNAEEELAIKSAFADMLGYDDVADVPAWPTPSPRLKDGTFLWRSPLTIEVVHSGKATPAQRRAATRAAYETLLEKLHDSSKSDQLWVIRRPGQRIPQTYTVVVAPEAGEGTVLVQGNVAMVKQPLRGAVILGSDTEYQDKLTHTTAEFVATALAISSFMRNASDEPVKPIAVAIINRAVKA